MTYYIYPKFYYLETIDPVSGTKADYIYEHETTFYKDFNPNLLNYNNLLSKQYIDLTEKINFNISKIYINNKIKINNKESYDEEIDFDLFTKKNIWGEESRYSPITLFCNKLDDATLNIKSQRRIHIWHIVIFTKMPFHYYILYANYSFLTNYVKNLRELKKEPGINYISSQFSKEFHANKILKLTNEIIHEIGYFTMNPNYTKKPKKGIFLGVVCLGFPSLKECYDGIELKPTFAIKEFIEIRIKKWNTINNYISISNNSINKNHRDWLTRHLK